MSLRDRRQAWTLDSRGDYTPLRPEPSGEGPESLGSQQDASRSNPSAQSERVTGEARQRRHRRARSTSRIECYGQVFDK